MGLVGGGPTWGLIMVAAVAWVVAAAAYIIIVGRENQHRLLQRRRRHPTPSPNDNGQDPNDRRER